MVYQLDAQHSHKYPFILLIVPGNIVIDSDKGKMVIYYMSVSLCLFSILDYIFLVLCCFSVLESFWKETEERSENRAKTSKIGKKLKSCQGRELAPWVTIC